MVEPFWGCSYDHKSHQWICKEGTKTELQKQDKIIPRVCNICPDFIEKLNLFFELKTWNLKLS